MTETPQPAPPTSLSTQLWQTGVGDIAGLAVAIGSVYVAEYICPQKTKSLIAKLARTLSHWRGTEPEVQQALAKKVADVTIMHIGGLVNAASQFSLHRYMQPPEERRSWGHDLARLGVGRVAIIPAVSMLALAEKRAPLLMKNSASQVVRLLGNRPSSQRIAELGVSAVTQMSGGMPAGIGAMLLFDHLTAKGGTKQPSHSSDEELSQTISR